jgi:hypothetical protein
LTAIGFGVWAATIVPSDSPTAAMTQKETNQNLAKFLMWCLFATVSCVGGNGWHRKTPAALQKNASCHRKVI